MDEEIFFFKKKKKPIPFPCLVERTKREKEKTGVVLRGKITREGIEHAASKAKHGL